METISIPKEKFEKMEMEIKMFRNSKIYQRLLEFEDNISEIKFTRKDTGF